MTIDKEQVLNWAKTELNITDTTLHDAKIEKLIDTAAGKLFATGTYLTLCATKTIDCNKAALPCDFSQVICFKLQPSATCSGCCGGALPVQNNITNNPMPGAYCSCPDYFMPSSSVLTNFCDSGCGSCDIYSNYFEIDGGYMVFPSTVKATSVKIYYKGLNRDDEGFMILTQEQEDALGSFAAFRFANIFSNTVPPRYTKDQKEFWWQNWCNGFNQLSGDKAIKDFQLNKGAIAQTVNAILFNKNPQGFGS